MILCGHGLHTLNTKHVWLRCVIPYPLGRTGRAADAVGVPKLQRGLRLLLLCVCMFAVVIFAARIESQATVRLGDSALPISKALLVCVRPRSPLVC